MILETVAVAGGTGELGRWGTLCLTGAESAIIRATQGEDIELPPEVAADLTNGVAVLNERRGRILFLPYAGSLIVAFDIATSEPLFTPIALKRDADRGMRVADIRFIERAGVLHLTEASLALFDENLLPVWRCDEDFGGWTFEGIVKDEIGLAAGDWLGNERRQIRSLRTGERTD